MSNIRKRRKELNMSGERLGELVGVQKAAISKYENELAQPSKEVLLKMADVLNCTVDYLLARTDDPTPPGEPDVTFDDLTVALHGELKDLTDHDKELILGVARSMKKQQEEDKNKD